PDGSLQSPEIGGIPTRATEEHGRQDSAPRATGRGATPPGFLSVEPIPVELTDAAFGGEALGHLPDGRVVFVPRALPGEAGLVTVAESRRDFARGELAELVRGAPGRVEPPCPYFTDGCG